MSFKIFKNTVLLFVLVLISCGSGNRSKDKVQNTKEMLRQAQHDT